MRVFECQETAVFRGRYPQQGIQRHVCPEVSPWLVGTLAIQPPFRCNLPYAEGTSEPEGDCFSTRWMFQCVEAQLQQQPSATLEPAAE